MTKTMKDDIYVENRKIGEYRLSEWFSEEFHVIKDISGLLHYRSLIEFQVGQIELWRFNVEKFCDCKEEYKKSSEKINLISIFYLEKW